MTQPEALSILQTGGNAFLTGEPGAGKTYVINQYISWLEAAGLKVAVTASTGIAATHIGGMTIHSWSRLGPRDSLSPQDLDYILQHEKTVKRIQNTHVLIIDEISMLSAELLNMVDRVCRGARHSTESFGGLQVVFVGDFFQLPPIVPRGEELHYAFQSQSWREAAPLICYLTDQYRQEDEQLLSLLQSIRKNDVDDDAFTLLSEQTDISYVDIEPTRLYTHNLDVDSVNGAELEKLSGTSRTFKMAGSGNKTMQQSLVKNCLSPEILYLKEDAMVMCTKNNFEAGYVNGTLGRVVGFSGIGWPEIETAEGKRITIEPATWEVIEDKKSLAAVEQVPLRLAWAITIHKSQGMSLDAAEIDLSKAFVFGQGYVALSRVRSLAGLKMIGMSPTALRVDPKVVQRDEEFRIKSEEAISTFRELSDEELEKMHRSFILTCGGTFPTEIPKGRATSYERIKKESTYAQTKSLLAEKHTISEIAKLRGMNTTTIWAHLEKLASDGELSVSMLTHLTSAVSDNYKEQEERVFKAIEACGEEKLKPLFEYCNEEIDYEVIRLVRLLHTLESGDK